MSEPTLRDLGRAAGHPDRTLETEIEDLARDLCDTYYLTVNPRPEWQMQSAYDKISEQTRVHWRAQAALLLEKGWTRDA